MLLKNDTYNAQSKLANYCRTGTETEITGALAKRLPQYRRLVYNIIKDTLATTYPIACKYIEKNTWEKICHDFFSNHPCSHPQVWRMPKEFLEYCKEKKVDKQYDLPYLNDLLYFEWLEAEMYMMEDKEFPSFRSSDNWFKKRLAINPEYELFKLDYPVHLTTPEEAGNKKGAYFVLLFREKESGRIQFVNLSALYAYLLESIARQEKILEQILADILYVFGINDLVLLQKETLKFLAELHNKGFVLGVLGDNSNISI
ncbi:putative DNA-binding domain-containing protein [uncultured Draconibacterium sp.]|uniref:HvfC/BufC N-terminal domain-containing protein n=1 Tax=uncultured Draconibacterium sp. TaxID=1573823 RepID=UPI0029C6DCBD|nr:putative DNA-binding domain-containing protein [uncultured Draconibacterium sp.]